MLQVIAVILRQSLLNDDPREGMPVLLPTHRAALALGEPLKQAAFVVHVHWVAIKLDDILVVREVLKTYGTHDGASLPFPLCELGL